MDSVKPPEAYLIAQLESMGMDDASVEILKEQCAMRAQAREAKAARQLLKGLLNASLWSV